MADRDRYDEMALEDLRSYGFSNFADPDSFEAQMREDMANTFRRVAEEARREEREQCAQVAESLGAERDLHNYFYLAQKIRARGDSGGVLEPTSEDEAARRALTREQVQDALRIGAVERTAAEQRRPKRGGSGG